MNRISRLLRTASVELQRSMGEQMRLEPLAGALFESVAVTTSSESAIGVAAMRHEWRVERAMELVDVHFDRPLSKEAVSSGSRTCSRTTCCPLSPRSYDGARAR